jgi:multidrug efflux system membrane fusion protein
MFLKKLFILSLAGMLLLACSSHDDEQAQVRAIKTMVIEGGEGGQHRLISGVVESAQRAELSFEVSGRVESVSVKLGSQLQSGAELARLESKAYQLAVDASQAELTKAQAILVDKKIDYTSKSKLYEDGRYVAKNVVDAAYADYQAAEQNVEAAKAKLSLSLRDLEHTVLRAPFSGEVASLQIEPAVNVAAGQIIMELAGEGGMEVALSLPESLRPVTQLDMPVSISFPTVKALKVPGVVSEIAARATEGNAFPVKIAFDPVQDVYPGLTAEVSFSYVAPGEIVVYLIPGVAIAPPQSDKEDGFVFRYDPQSSTVTKVPVKIRGIQGTQLEIVEGLKAGDIIAIAGVHFLNDGQKVKLMKQD